MAAKYNLVLKLVTLPRLVTRHFSLVTRNSSLAAAHHRSIQCVPGSFCSVAAYGRHWNKRIIVGSLRHVICVVRNYIFPYCWKSTPGKQSGSFQFLVTFLIHPEGHEEQEMTNIPRTKRRKLD
jgi:hypothetical protein